MYTYVIEEKQTSSTQLGGLVAYGIMPPSPVDASCSIKKNRYRVRCIVAISSYLIFCAQKVYSLFTFYFTVAVRVRYAGATDEDLDGADTHTQTHCTRAGISRRGPRRPERRKRGQEASRTTGRSTLKRHLFDCDFFVDLFI